MATTHPYISGAGNIAQMVTQLRKSFPPAINSETVKKLGLAPNNESYVINVLQYVGVIDPDGKKTAAAAKVFSVHKDDEFAKGFAELVKEAYSGLFELHGEGSWQLSSDDLITFFRNSDQTSATIGQRQANTFRILAGLAGYGDIPEAKPKKGAKPAVKSFSKPKVKVAIPTKVDPKNSEEIKFKEGGQFGLTVRVEINLPGDGTKETYDNIFKSIKENLLGG